MSNFPKRRDGFYYHAGRAYPSVTTILKCIAKPALRNWYARRAAELIFSDPETYSDTESVMSGIYSKSNNAMTRGSDVHSIAEEMAHTYPEEIKMPSREDPHYGYALSIKSFFQTMQPTVIHSEVNLYNDSHMYAGTADLIATLKDGKTWLIDWKTSRAIYPEMALQLAAYQNAEWLLDGEDKKRTKDNYGFPQIDSCAIVLLRPDGTFQWSPQDTDGLLEVFLGAKRVWEYLNKN